MGNAAVSVGLRTEKMSYKAGERVNGTVYVSVTQESHPIQSILLQVEGQEHALVHYTTNYTETNENGREEDTQIRDHYDECTTTFMKIEHPLQTFPTGQIHAGQFEYPFSIQLPQNLPSTMKCNKVQSKCAVEYKLKAIFAKPRSNLFSTNPSAEQGLTIMAAPPLGESLENTSLMLPVDEVPVNSCCCRNKGTVVLQAQFNKTTVKPKDTIGVKFRCVNESSVKVKKVVVQLESVITWRGRQGSRDETVREVIDRREMHAEQFPELAKHYRKLRGPLRQTNFYDNMGTFPNSDSSWRQAYIQIPAFIKDSFDGRSIQVRHLVSVQLLTDGCCTNNVDATTMVQVFQSLPPNANSNANVNEETSSNTATAPSSIYDEYSVWKDDDQKEQDYSAGGYNAPTAIATPIGSHDVYDGSSMVQVQALPPNWHAQTAQVVEIPMAEAMVVESTWEVTETRDD